jgi:hypothetical protein
VHTAPEKGVWRPKTTPPEELGHGYPEMDGDFCRDLLNVWGVAAEESSAIPEGFEARTCALPEDHNINAWSHDADE